MVAITTETKIELVSKENREEIQDWEVFLQSTEDGNILQSTMLADVFIHAGFDWTLLIAKKNKDIVGGALSTVWPGNRKFKPLRHFSTYKTTYGPIVIENEKSITTSILRELERSIARNNPMQHILLTKHTWTHETIAPLKYEFRPDEVGCTFLIDIYKPEEKLWKEMERAARSRIGKARKYGVEVREELTIDAPQKMYELHLETVKRLGIAPNPLSFFQGIYDCLA